MFFSRRSRRAAHKTPVFRPSVSQLEDRTVPSTTANPAAHLQVTVPENVYAGRAFEVDVQVLDASNQPASGFTDTVQLSLSAPTTNAGSTLPGSYTFTARSHGYHEFTVTLGTLESSQTIVATDITANSTVTAGSATTTVLAAPLTTHLLVKMEGNVTTGSSTYITVEALDAANSVDANYTGTITFANSDTAATALANYTFVASDNGVHTFKVTFNTTGPQTVTATDTVTKSITGSADRDGQRPGFPPRPSRPQLAGTRDGDPFTGDGPGN